jgi:hypothetical protein
MLRCISWPAQVEVAVLQADFFIGHSGLGGREGQRLAVVQQAQLVGDDFDFAGGHVGVDGPRRAADVPDDGDNKFRADMRRLCRCTSAGRFPSTTTCVMPLAVAKVEEDEVAEIAPTVDPAHEHNGLEPASEARSSPHI